jgi:membrane associated rhomboid family serine protease
MKEEKKLLWGSDRNAVIAVMAILLIVFVFFRMMFIIFQNNPFTLDREYSNLIQQFALPVEWKVFITKPWTLFTYFITNIRYIDLVTNLVWVLGFSYLAQQLVGNRYIIPVFIYGGIVGGITLLITSLFITPTTFYALGSSTGILALATMLCYHSAHYKLMPQIKTGIPLWLLYLLFIVVDIVVVINNDIFHLPAHIAAVLVGCFCGFLIKKGVAVGSSMNKLYQFILGK